MSTNTRNESVQVKNVQVKNDDADCLQSNMKQNSKNINVK